MHAEIQIVFRCNVTCWLLSAQQSSDELFCWFSECCFVP